MLLHIQQCGQCPPGREEGSSGMGVHECWCWDWGSRRATVVGVALCSVWVILTLLGFPGSSGPGQWKCCHPCQFLAVHIWVYPLVMVGGCCGLRSPR